MNKAELQKRTKQFAVDVIRFTATFPGTLAAQVVGRQLIRAACSVGSNYREANRAESKADFIHKLGIVEKEASESEYWLEVALDVDMGSTAVALSLSREANELLRIFGASRRTAKRKSEIGNRKLEITSS